MVYGAALFGTVLFFSSDRQTDTTLVSAQACVRDQFVQNGFNISSSVRDPGGARISGTKANVPIVTVFLQKGSPTEIRLGGADGRFPILPKTLQLSSVQQLAEGITSQCSKGRNNLLSVHRLSAQPS